MKKTLSKNEVDHLAKLSALQLSEQEKEKITKQFSETLDYIENLKELDTTNVNQIPHVSGQQNVFFEDGEKNMRNLSKKEVTANAKKTKNGLFVVEKIL